MLLIIAGETSENDEVWLTNEHAATWYGMSARSIEAGIEDLRDHGLLTERVEWIKAPLSAIGSTKRHWYRLTGPFSTDARRALQDTARQEYEARTGTPTSPTRHKQGRRTTKKTAKKNTSRNTTRKSATKRPGASGRRRA